MGHAGHVHHAAARKGIDDLVTEEPPRPKSTRGQIAIATGIGALLLILGWNGYADSRRAECASVSQRPTNVMGTALSSRWSWSDGCEILAQSRWGEDGGEWMSQSNFEAIYLIDDGIQ